MKKRIVHALLFAGPCAVCQRRGKDHRPTLKFDVDSIKELINTCHAWI